VAVLTKATIPGGKLIQTKINFVFDENISFDVRLDLMFLSTKITFCESQSHDMHIVV